jgi:hypothetical protein
MNAWGALKEDELKLLIQELNKQGHISVENGKIHGVPVTTPLRAILDLWQSEDVPRDVLQDAFKEGTRLGKITRKQIQAASKNPHWQRAIEQITEGNAA